MTAEASTGRDSLLDRIPYAERTYPAMVARGARLKPGATFLTTPAGDLTFGELHRECLRVAGGLRGLGLDPGDVTAILLSNRPEYPAAWWSHGWWGGVAALVHPDYRGKQLSHALALAAPRTLIVEDAILAAARAELVACASIEHVIVVGDSAVEPWPGVAFHRWRDLGPAFDDDPVAIPSAAATIMYTSGTSGGSKAVLRSHHYDFIYAALNADGHRHGDDVHLYSPSSACHVRTGICVMYAALIVLGRATIAHGFSARGFWAEMAATGATHAYLSGATVNILMKNEPGPSERGHRLRVIQSLPAPADPPAVERRFGCRLVTQAYGSTECYAAPPQVDDQDWTRPLNCIGRPHPLMEVMLADSEGRPVPADGQARGEILVRPRIAHAIMTAYYGDPEATARAFADLWYRTGDLGSWDATGYLYFGGRATDTIRRRGENISALEIEEAAVEHPAVLEAAAYGVPSDLGEFDVKLDVILDPGVGAVSEAALAEFLAARLARWAVPRYIEIVAEFPRTATFKVQKSALRAAPLSGRAYDREMPR